MLQRKVLENTSLLQKKVFENTSLRENNFEFAENNFASLSGRRLLYKKVKKTCYNSFLFFFFKQKETFAYISLAFCPCNCYLTDMGVCLCMQAIQNNVFGRYSKVFQFSLFFYCFLIHRPPGLLLVVDPSCNGDINTHTLLLNWLLILEHLC